MSSRDVEVVALNDDARLAIDLQNVEGAGLFHIKTPQNAPVLQLHDSKDVTALRIRGLNDGKQE